METIRDIIIGCGGTELVGRAVDLTASAVHKWFSNGIPEQYWSALCRLKRDLTIEQLHAANEAVRAAASGKAA